jgi:hypothetical protein
LAWIFRRLCNLLEPGGSLVVTLGNTWAPPEQSLDSITAFDAIRRSVRLDFNQWFFLHHRDARMSPSVRFRRDHRRAPDHVSHAWWFGPPGAQVTAPSNLVNLRTTIRERRWLEHAGYHAALPVAAPAFFIAHLTEPDDLVLDPFAGLNATGVAAEILGRRWLSVDNDPLMAALARDRPRVDVPWRT